MTRLRVLSIICAMFYYDTLGELYRDTKRIFDDANINPHLFQLGFWPGGDRDGNLL